MDRTRYKMNIILISLFLLAPGTSLLAADTAGRVQGEFLRIGINSRPAGMGEAFCAVADNANAICWNAAGLAQLESREVSATHSNYVGGIGIGAVSYAQGLGENGAVGLDINTLYMENVRRAADSDNETGKFMNYNEAIALGYARRCGERVLAGIALKSLQFKLDDESTGGISADAGMLYKCGDLKAGVALQNVGAEIGFPGDEKGPLSTNIKLGMSYKVSRALLAADLNAPVYGTNTLSLGCEYCFSEVMTFRCGYKAKADGNEGIMDGIALGIGIKIKNFCFDYAFVPVLNDFERLNKVSFTVKF